MRFDRIVIERFGRIRGLDTGDDPLSALVAVVGPNEAGKSTLFHFLVSILYGFYPATRDANPYTPWGEGDIEGAVFLRTGAGECVEVRRRLLSAPDGTLVRSDRSEDLRNRTVPFAEHVPRDLFGQLYALGLSELTGIEDESWSTVQDRLMGGMGARDVRPPLEVAAELEDEAGRLWRPTRRGNQRIRDLDDRIRQLRRDRREAADRDRELREKARALEEARASLSEAREERERLRLREERTASLLPVRKQLRRIAELEERARDPEGLLEGLPADPAGRRSSLREETRELESRIEKLTDRSRELAEEREAFGDRERTLLEEEERLASLAARATGSAGDLRSRIGELEQQVRDLERRCEGVVRELFEVPFEEIDPERMRTLPIRELRRRLQRYRRLRRERRIRQEALRIAGRSRAPGSSAAPLLWGGAGALAAGAALLGFALWQGRVPAGFGGAGLLALGIGALLAGLRARARATGAGAASDAEATAEEAEARSAVSDLLSDLSFRAPIREEPPEELARELERLQELLDDRAERRDRLKALRGDLAELRERLQRAAETTGLDLPEQPEAAGHTLTRAIDRARKVRERARAASQELERLQEERESLAFRKKEIEEEAEELDRRLRRLGDGDVDAGIEEARRRIDARERARGLRAELERAHPDLPKLEERIREADEGEAEWELDDEARAELRAEIQRLGERIEALRGETEGLEKEVDHLRREITVDEIEGEIRTRKDERERLIRDHDRKYLMAKLLRQADRSFREAHQPDVVRRAGEYLGLVTGGRYDRILLGENAAEETDLRLREPATGRLIPVEEPLSTGTRQQVYLALRLALVDHLDSGGERLPLFLDEAFVNWDARRRERGFALLERIGERRQVFLFTCHRSMADELEARGARTLALDDGR